MVGSAIVRRLQIAGYTNIVTRWVRVGKADPAKIQRAVDQNGSGKVNVLFESEERQATFLAQGAEATLSRLAKAEFAALDADFLRSLSGLEDRRHKLTVTLSGDHFYVDTGKDTFDGPLIRGTFSS